MPTVINSLSISHNVLHTHCFIKIQERKRKLFLAQTIRLVVVKYILLYFDWSRSPERPSQPIPRLTRIQLSCISSDSVTYCFARGIKWYSKESVQKGNKLLSSPGMLNSVGHKNFFRTAKLWSILPLDWSLCA